MRVASAPPRLDSACRQAVRRPAEPLAQPQCFRCSLRTAGLDNPMAELELEAVEAANGSEQAIPEGDVGQAAAAAAARFSFPFRPKAVTSRQAAWPGRVCRSGGLAAVL